MAFWLCPRLLRVRVLVASYVQFSGVTLVCKAAEEEMNGSTAESDGGYLGSMSVSGAAQWVKLREVAKIQILQLPQNT
jgi:uncharacterized membrane protein YhhN